MLALPRAAEPLLTDFSIAFSRPTYQRAITLLIGAILAMGRRTVTNVLWTVRSAGSARTSWRGSSTAIAVTPR